ncbi:PepSY domain-containing protein [Psychrobacillus sp. INOP01]|uniref:PepSY domain-containing protein n=1 Tax=Psychrobacillus sp. INOP01 TaxID=2829187 RepID=UPI001BA68E4C|nr:PepSY domain-containing protein [Psychrobacillus sp. INOP01]QUG40208.1 PepSY domain-containing protein [Psychrobacillus sp. INOP01]
MKKLVIGSLAAALVISGGIGINALADDDNINLSKTQSEKLIGIEKAKEVALKEATGTIESVDLEKNNGKTFYEVDIDGEKSKDYEVRVDAYNSKVLNVREDNDDRDDDDDQDKVTTSTKLITEAKAIEIAQKQIQGTLSDIKLDSDDGRYEYEIELRTAKGKAEFTIDASTGEILEHELDNDDDDRYDD